MRHALAALVLLATTAAVAAPKAIAVAQGDCRDAALRTDAAAFHRELQARWGDALHSPEVVLSLLQPRPALALTELKRQVESARTLFYGGQYDRARELARQAVVELEKTSPLARPWPVLADALLLEGLALKALDRKVESAEAFRRVLRVDPSHRLDPDYFTPSTIQAFDALRRDLSHTRKVTLTLQSLAGAEVFVDGRSVGAAPVRLEVAPAAYRLSVALGARVSFPHVVTVSRDATVSIDLTFEGALASEVPLCLDTPHPPDAAQASALASAVGAEQLVLVWAAPGGALLGRSLKGDQPWRDSQRALPPAALAELLATGAEPAPAVDAPTAAVAPVAPVLAAPIPAVAAAEPAPRKPALGRTVGWGLLGAGAALAVGGTVAFVVGGADRQRLDVIAPAGVLAAPESPEHREALDLIPRVDGNRTLSLGLWGGGVGLLAAGVLAVVLFGGSDAPAIALTPAGVSVAGSF